MQNVIMWWRWAGDMKRSARRRKMSGRMSLSAGAASVLLVTLVLAPSVLAEDNFTVGCGEWMPVEPDVTRVPSPNQALPGQGYMVTRWSAEDGLKAESEVLSDASVYSTVVVGAEPDQVQATRELGWIWVADEQEQGKPDYPSGATFILKVTAAGNSRAQAKAYHEDDQSEAKGSAELTTVASASFSNSEGKWGLTSMQEVKLLAAEGEDDIKLTIKGGITGGLGIPVPTFEWDLSFNFDSSDGDPRDQSGEEVSEQSNCLGTRSINLAAVDADERPTSLSASVGIFCTSRAYGKTSNGKSKAADTGIYFKGLGSAEVSKFELQGPRAYAAPWYNPNP
jgi:hypothetical protein